MIVLASTHRAETAKLVGQALAWKHAHDTLLGRWNKLVARVNAKGGEAFLDGSNAPPQLSREDIKRLLMLCHPDVHGGKPGAVEMTQKLLALNEWQA